VAEAEEDDEVEGEEKSEYRLKCLEKMSDSKSKQAIIS
jgi:hypothetical protein